MPEQRLRKLEDRIEKLEETIEIVSDKKLLRSIQSGLKDLKLGRYQKYENIDPLFADV